MIEERTSGSPVGFFVVGAIVGTVLGLLYAPKAGSEIREDLLDFGRTSREKGSSLMSKISDRIPGRFKVAGAYGAAKEMGKEGFREVKERVEG